MDAIDRLHEYKDDNFDKVILKIRNGTIKSGRWAHLVKIDKGKKLQEGRLFNDGTESKDTGE